jgi:two-component system NtrC family sensor kinase
LSKLDIQSAVKEPLIKYLDVIESETKRCGNIVKGLLDFSRKDQENFEDRHLHSLLKDSYNLMSHQMHIANIHFYTDFQATSDFVHCNDSQIKQVCVALFVNAQEAIMQNGEILIKTSNPDADSIKIEVIDNGIGIAPGDITRIFQPFFSVKQNASGIGLGLAIVHGIVKRHKGEINVSSEPGKGTTMSILFPLVTKRV